VRPPAVPADSCNLDEELATVDDFFEAMNVHVSGSTLRMKNKRRVILANRGRRSSERETESALTWCECGEVQHLDGKKVDAVGLSTCDPRPFHRISTCLLASRRRK
jgi:hypothetical protein